MATLQDIYVFARRYGLLIGLCMMAGVGSGIAIRYLRPIVYSAVLPAPFTADLAMKDPKAIERSLSLGFEQSDLAKGYAAKFFSTLEALAKAENTPEGAARRSLDFFTKNFAEGRADDKGAGDPATNLALHMQSVMSMRGGGARAGRGLLDYRLKLVDSDRYELSIATYEKGILPPVTIATTAALREFVARYNDIKRQQQEALLAERREKIKASYSTEADGLAEPARLYKEEQFRLTLAVQELRSTVTKYLASASGLKPNEMELMAYTRLQLTGADLEGTPLVLQGLDTGVLDALDIRMIIKDIALLHNRGSITSADRDRLLESARDIQSSRMRLSRKFSVQLEALSVTRESFRGEYQRVLQPLNPSEWALPTVRELGADLGQSLYISSAERVESPRAALLAGVGAIVGLGFGLFVALIISFLRSVPLTNIGCETALTFQGDV